MRHGKGLRGNRRGMRCAYGQSRQSRDHPVLTSWFVSMLPAIWNAFTAGRDNGELKKRPGFFADRTRASHERICGLEKPAIKMKALVDKNLCTGCGACESECPAGAIKVSELAEVDATLCTGCGACVEACPLEALSMK